MRVIDEDKEEIAFVVLGIGGEGMLRVTQICSCHCSFCFCHFRSWIIGNSWCPCGGGRVEGRNGGQTTAALINLWRIKVTVAVLSGYG